MWLGSHFIFLISELRLMNEIKWLIIAFSLLYAIIINVCHFDTLFLLYLAFSRVSSWQEANTLFSYKGDV